MYHGFKMGGGVYKEFMFAEPPLAEGEEEKKELGTRKERFGTVQVLLYDSIEVPRGHPTAKKPTSYGTTLTKE